MTKTSPFIFLNLLVIVVLVFSCHMNKPGNSLSEERKMELINRGQEIVTQSFQALSTELSKALQEGSVQNAVSYCHLKASPITDSLSNRFNVKINRISLKYRNPENKADLTDMAILDAYRQQLAEGKSLQAHLEVTDDAITYYSPIVIQNPLCLLCHGEPGRTIDPENHEFIKTKYPDDLATGYQLGDLRGAWKVVFINPNAD